MLNTWSAFLRVSSGVHRSNLLEVFIQQEEVKQWGPQRTEGVLVGWLVFH